MNRDVLMSCPDTGGTLAITLSKAGGFVCYRLDDQEDFWMIRNWRMALTPKVEWQFWDSPWVGTSP